MTSFNDFRLELVWLKLFLDRMFVNDSFFYVLE